MSLRIRKNIFVFLAWLVAGLLYSAQSYYYRMQIGQPVEWSHTLMVDTPYFLVWAVFTPLPLYLFRRFPYNRKKLLVFVSVHIFAALLVSFMHAFLYNGFRLLVRDSEFTLERTWLNAVASVDYSLLVYFIILLAIGIYDYYIGYQKLQTTLARSQLENVRMRLQPHFLFNTLNSISVLIKENPQKAGTTIENLSDLLRHVLKNMDNQFNELGKEIEFLKKYISIEQIRFGSRLQVSIDCPQELNNIMVPSLLLQPLVENAVQHGIAKNTGKGRLEICARSDNGRIEMTVSNNGHLQSEKKAKGLGLQLTRERLKALYGLDYAFDLAQTEKNEVRASITIPRIQEHTS